MNGLTDGIVVIDRCQPRLRFDPNRGRLCALSCKSRPFVSYVTTDANFWHFTTCLDALTKTDCPFRALIGLRSTAI